MDNVYLPARPLALPITPPVQITGDDGGGMKDEIRNTRYEIASHGDFFEIYLTTNHFVRIIYNKLNKGYRKRRIWRRSVNQGIRMWGIRRPGNQEESN